MTPARLSHILAELHWSNRALAKMLGITEQTVRAWLHAKPVPDVIADWLEQLAAAHRHNPPPEEW
jgi:predicted transcriptional regulator